MSNNLEFNGQCAYAISTGRTEVNGRKHTAKINGNPRFFFF